MHPATAINEGELMQDGRHQVQCGRGGVLRGREEMQGGREGMQGGRHQVQCGRESVLRGREGMPEGRE